jgi:hypothetical protein
MSNLDATPAQFLYGRNSSASAKNAVDWAATKCDS